MRCRRCGRKLTIRYTGAKHGIPRYSCWRGLLDNGEPRCIAFGGLRVDDAIEEALPQVVEPGAIAAATEAEAQPADVEARIAAHDATAPGPSSLAVLDATRLAGNLRAIWAGPTTDARLKKRIVRAVIHEVVADIDDGASEIVLLIHWIGCAQTELRLPKRRRGHRNSTAPEIIVAVRHLALIASDDLIAGILNRSRLLTGHGNRWTRERVTPCARITGSRCSARPPTASSRGST
ncbi:zinc ribbon domain-containing protein [Cereibacter azotoformans]|uniref:zinc ribbon domain-containing protein n=1 Tax=Cereibacter azotoformans TaxID=43057 RepID=UPI00195B9423|nr:zinc ribbon domain-containing protein [Cereibacter azotoformans]